MKLSDPGVREYILNCYGIKSSSVISKELNISRGVVTNTWFKAGLHGAKK